MNSLQVFEWQSEDFWLPYQNQGAVQQVYSGQVYSGQVFIKNRSRKWEAIHLDLYSDKLIRQQNEYTPINYCTLKKIKNSESSFQPYKHGLRLCLGRQKIELFMDAQDSFEKWYTILRRYCLLPKFSKKYKLISKHKLQESYPAQTYKVLRSLDQLYFQVRVVDKSQLQDKVQLLREISILRRFDHLFVQHIQEVYEDQQHIYIVYDQYAGRELKHIIPQLIQCNERQLAEFIFKALQAIHHIHSRGVFHRDIKFDNIFNRFPDSITDVCVVNFQSADICEKKNHKRIGTPGFMAPEIFKTKQYDFKVDVYSLGVIFYYLSYGKMPFSGEYNEVNVLQIYREILRQNEQGDVQFPKCRISYSGVELLRLMMEKDPEKRPSSYQALNHHWFINMKVREQLSKPGQARYGSGINLSTILEKSDMIDASNMSIAITPRKNLSSRSKSQNDFIGLQEQEFITESLFDRMKQLQSFIKTPSRRQTN